MAESRMPPAEAAWDEYVNRVNPRLDRGGVHLAYVAGFAAGQELERERQTGR